MYALERMKPTIGRIVIYNHDGVMLPAIINEVHESGAVRLFCFGYDGPISVGGVNCGNGNREWNWPPRV
jgi:hypothetical protein